MHIKTKNSKFFILERSWVEKQFTDPETCFWSCRQKIFLDQRVGFLQPPGGLEAKQLLILSILLNFAYRNSWRLLKHKSVTMKAGYTSAKGIQLTVSIIPVFAKSSLLTAVPEFCLYRLNVILQVSWTKYIDGTSVWVCYMYQIYLTLFKYCIPNCDELGVCEPDSLLGSYNLLWKNYCRKE